MSMAQPASHLQLGPGLPPIFTISFILAFTGHFFIGLAFWPYVLLPGFLDALGYDSFMIGVIMGAASISGVFIRLWVGGGLDRWGRKPMLVSASALFVVVNLAYLWINDTGLPIFVVRIAHGFAVGPIFAAIMTYAADVIPELRRTEGLAYFGIAGHLSGAVGVMMGEALLRYSGYPGVFVSGAVMSAVAILFFMFLKEPVRDGMAAVTDGLWTTITQRKFLRLWIVSLAFALGMASYFTFLKPFALSVGLVDISYFFATYSGTAVLIRIFGARVPGRFGQYRVLVFSLACLAMGIWLIVHLPTASGLMITGMLCGIGHGYGFPILSAIIVDVADKGTRGTAVTFYTLLFDVGFLIGAPLWGLLIHLGGYTAMFYSAALVVVCGMMMALKRGERRPNHFRG